MLNKHLNSNHDGSEYIEVAEKEKSILTNAISHNVCTQTDKRVGKKRQGETTFCVSANDYSE